MDSIVFDATCGCLIVSGEFTVYQAQQARDALVDAKRGGQLCSLDLGAVTEIDTSAVQLLLRLPQGVKITQASDAVHKVFTLLSLQDRLQDGLQEQAT